MYQFEMTMAERVVLERCSPDGQIPLALQEEFQKAKFYWAIKGGEPELPYLMLHEIVRKIDPCRQRLSRCPRPLSRWQTT